MFQEEGSSLLQVERVIQFCTEAGEQSDEVLCRPVAVFQGFRRLNQAVQPLPRVLCSVLN